MGRRGTGILSGAGVIDSVLYSQEIVEIVSNNKAIRSGDNYNKDKEKKKEDNNNNENKVDIKKQTQIKMKVKNIIKLIGKICRVVYRVLEYIKGKIFVLYSKLTLDFKTNYKYSYIIPFLFKNLGSDIPTNAEPIVTFSFNMFILSLIILSCFINITGYFISIYLITKYKIEDKYPKFTKIIKYFEKSSIFFVTIEILICLVCLITIILLNLNILRMFIF